FPALEAATSVWKKCFGAVSTQRCATRRVAMALPLARRANAGKSSGLAFSMASHQQSHLVTPVVVARLWANCAASDDCSIGTGLARGAFLSSCVEAAPVLDAGVEAASLACQWEERPRKAKPTVSPTAAPPAMAANGMRILIGPVIVWPGLPA